MLRFHLSSSQSFLSKQKNFNFLVGCYGSHNDVFSTIGSTTSSSSTISRKLDNSEHDNWFILVKSLVHNVIALFYLVSIVFQNRLQISCNCTANDFRPLKKKTSEKPTITSWCLSFKKLWLIKRLTASCCFQLHKKQCTYKSPSKRLKGSFRVQLLWFT